MPAPLTIALAMSLLAKEPASKNNGWLQTGRLIDEPTLHLGVRHASYFDGSELDLGVTIQITL